MNLSNDEEEVSGDRRSAAQTHINQFVIDKCRNLSRLIRKRDFGNSDYVRIDRIVSCLRDLTGITMCCELVLPRCMRVELYSHNHRCKQKQEGRRQQAESSHGVDYRGEEVESQTMEGQL